MLKVGILESKDFSKEVYNRLKEISSVNCFRENEDIYNFIKDKDVLFVRLNYQLDDVFLENAKNLKYICTPTTGLNHINVDYCESNNIKILSLKNEKEFLATIRATPEHTFGLILALLRNYNKCFLNNETSSWDRDLYKGNELFQKNIGIIGLGRVGKLLSKYINAFDANIYYYDTNQYINSVTAKKEDNIESLINKSDVVLLTASYDEENDKFFNKDYIDLLKDKYFINTARGELVDEEYLLKKIEESYFRGIAIDVISNESKSKNNLKRFLYLSKKNKLLLTSHISGATYESMWRTEEFIYKKLLKEINNEI